MRLLFVGNFDTRGTGYATILTNTCSELAGRGHQVTVLGMSWDRSEHTFPFQVIPTDYTWVPMQVLRVHQALSFDHVILAMDVPKIVQVLDNVRMQKLDWPHPSGLFPIESDPLVSVWVDGLAQLHRRLCISRFGQRVLDEVGLDSVYLPMTANLPSETLDKREARRALKKWIVMGNEELLDGEGPVALTVADNQERKDLPVIAQALVQLRDEVDVTWLLVTSFNSPYGWYLPDLLERTGVTGQAVVFDGLPAEDLERAYFAADFFVIASQAEGACLPLYEAMAHDLPCIGPDHTAVSEALADERGVLVSHNGRTIHPWGNVHRYHTRAEDLARAMTRVAHPGDERLTEFIEGRPWSDVAARIEEALDG